MGLHSILVITSDPEETQLALNAATITLCRNEQLNFYFDVDVDVQYITTRYGLSVKNALYRRVSTADAYTIGTL